jgi:lysophospholipase L1-like esterase
MAGGERLMPLSPRKAPLKVDFWRAFGHSWLQYQTGPSGDQTGRYDALFRSALDVEYNSWKNFGSSGGRIAGHGRGPIAGGGAGWTKVAQRLRPPTGRTGPYAPDGGGTLFCYGINDLAAYGGQTANVRTAIVHAHRACISRARASREYLTTDAAFGTWAAGWTNNGSGADLGMGTVDRTCVTTTAATITLTLPADYKGETVAFAFLQRPDATGITITWSGTAMTGKAKNGATFNTAQGLTAAMGTHGWMVERFTDLTSAQAGLTIVGTCTARDGGTGQGFFDGAWLESLTPPPVIVCNIATPTTAGYAALNAFFTTWTGQSNEAGWDADVATYNGLLATMIQEFDGMVQLADVNSLISKDATAYSDGIHPNEYGAGKLVDATVAALERMSPPVSATSSSICFNPPSPRVAGRRKPRVVNNWYTAEFQAASATYTPVAGHMFAIPIEITEPRDQWNQFAIEVTTAGSTQSTIRWGIYEDVNYDGYPAELLSGMDVSVAGAFSVANSTGVKTSATFTTIFVPDPGLYWLSIKIDTVGTSQILRGMTGSNHLMPNVTTTGLPIAGGYMGWQLTGQATGVMPTSWPTGGALVATVPYHGMKKSK